MVGQAKAKTQAEEIDKLIDYLKEGGGIGDEIEKKLSELPESYSVILVAEREGHDITIGNLVRILQKDNMQGLFVTINKSANALLEMLQKKDIKTENLFVVDVISKGKSDQKLESEKISCVDSAQNLTEIEAQVTDFAKEMGQGPKFFILDSVSTLLIYNAEKNVEKFVHGLGERLRTMNFKSVFTITKETRPEIMSVLAQFTDRVIKTTPKINP